MNTKQDFSEQKFDHELRKLVKVQKGQKLSSQFTEDIMNRIAEEKVVFTYQPIISKWTMILIFVLFGVLLLLTQFQSGRSTDGLWVWPESLTIPITGLFTNWQFLFQSFSMQSLISSGLFLAISGVVLALVAHYIFVVVVANQSIKKMRQMLAF